MGFAEVCAQVAAAIRPFAQHNVRTPGLEALCVARLLRSIASESDIAPEDLSHAIKDLVGSGALQGMPAALTTIAEAPPVMASASATVQRPAVEEAFAELLALLLKQEAVPGPVGGDEL